MKKGRANLKYFGSIYRGNIKIYDTHTLKTFNDPYEALLYANSEWNREESEWVARLLIVLRKSDSTESAIPEDKAYFQYTDDKACERFAEQKSEIRWSSDKRQIWNGNAKMMA